jgi:hypothetical protein
VARESFLERNNLYRKLLFILDSVEMGGLNMKRTIEKNVSIDASESKFDRIEALRLVKEVDSIFVKHLDTDILFFSYLAREHSGPTAFFKYVLQCSVEELKLRQLMFRMEKGERLI